MTASQAKPAKSQLIELVVMLTITAVAYSPILFNFFLGDDFVHLSWLSKCLQDPGLLLFNFNHSWLDVVTTKFYRPLISVFMFTDYLLWRTNGFGFHLTNVLFHLSNCALIYGITTTLEQRLASDRNNKERKAGGLDLLRWPFLAALLFGLYPLHPEAVSWITGRVDTIVTTFYLGSLYAYIKWSLTRKTPYLVLSLIANVLALMSKEMAVTIPVGVLLWEVFRGGKEGIKSVIKSTWAFWLILAIYFAVRRLSLGTFVGGYDNSLLFVANPGAFISGWVHAIRMTLVPINRGIIGDKNLLTIGWSIGMLTALGGILKALLTPAVRGTVFLLTGLVVISILPVYKIFAIADNLESSRLVYLPSAFLCMLLTLGLRQLFRAHKPLSNRSITVISTLITIFFSCGFALLWRNNIVWRDAGLESTAIRSSLEKICKNLPTATHLLLIGLPDQINGAYVCRNATPGIVESPQFSKSLEDCIFLNSYDPVFPFGFLKQSLQECSNSVHIWYWNKELQDFCKVSLPASGTGTGEQVVPPLKQLGKQQHQPQDNSESQGALAFNKNSLPCWSTDFVFFADDKNKDHDSNSKFSFANEIRNNHNPDSQLSVYDFKSATRIGEVMPLRASAIWACGDKGELFHRLDVHTHSAGVLDSQPFTVVQATELMPIIDFEHSGYLGSKGFLHLSPAHPAEKIWCKQNDVPDADHFSIEILRPNQFLAPAEQNGTEPAAQKMKEMQGVGKTGFIELKATDLAGPGLYQARLWSVDKNQKHLCLAGDHIIIALDP